MSVRRLGLFWMPGLRARIAGVSSVVVLASLLAVPQVAGAAPGGTATDPDITPRSVPVEKAELRRREVPELPAFTPRPPVWPAAASVAVDLPAPAQADAAGPMASAARTVFSVGRPAATAEAPAAAAVSRARLEVLDQVTAAKAGVNGVLFRIGRADGGLAAARVRVDVDTSGFSGAFGGDWASRLRVVAFPGCLLSTPEAEGCATPYRVAASKLNNRTGLLSAEVDAIAAQESSSSAGRGAFAGVDGAESLGAPMVLALTGGQSSDAGDFTQTPFSSSFEWAAGGSSGDFTWSYDMPAPPAPGGLEPKIGLGYSSGAVDGQTAGKNTQPGSVGEGWNLNAGGYIERSYRPCFDDLDNSPHYTQTTDLCWRQQNARLVWGGKSTELFQDATGKWHLQDDDGELIQKYAGSSNGDQGDAPSNTGEYWAVTAQDGTKYYFGLNTVPGNQQTNSTSTVRVRANHADDECFNASAGYQASSCWQAYRWDLAYVVDVHGNAMAYFYEKESQRSRFGASATQSYDRASRLVRIEYGVRASVGFIGTPPAAVHFGWSIRCVPAPDAPCGTEANPTAENWPDTPLDLDCAMSATSCPNNPSPSFWTKKRLTKVTTKIRTGSGDSTLTVDEWALEQLFPQTGNTTSPVLWLQEINRTGKAKTTEVALPELRFGGTRLDQRALWNPNLAQHRKYRIDEVFTETGGHIGVTYLGQDSGCQYGSATPDPDNNIRRCFPKFYRIDGDDDPVFAWWHKYIVLQVVESGNVTGTTDVVHDYAYTLGSSSAASQVLWGHDNGPAVWSSSLTYRSWGSWRGYTDVTETVGPTAGPRSQTKRIFMRGLRFDRTDSGLNRDALVKNSLTEWVGDYLWAQGHLLEELRYASPGGQVLSKSLYQPYNYPTGTRTLPASWATPNTFEAVIARTAHERTYTWLPASSTFRQTKTLNTWHPTYGYRTEVSELGDQVTPTTNDDRCTRTWYIGRTDGPYLVGFPRQTQVAGAACTVASVPANVLSDTRFFYDGHNDNEALPELGNVTRTEQVSSFTGGTPNWVKTATAGYDAWGRVTSTGDALDRVTTTAYTHNVNDLLSTVTTTNPATHATTVTVDPAWSLPRIVADTNGKITTVQHDALGRVLKVWRDNRSTGATPNAEYIYTIDHAKLAAPYTQTKTLSPAGTDSTRISSYEIADGLLRTRQVQTTAPDGRRTITDTVYDGRGLPAKTSTFYNNSGPNGTLVTFADINIDTQARYSYDGLGRQTSNQYWSLNVKKWETVTTYGGDRVSVDAPVGGTSTTSIVDVRGRQTALWQYTGASPAGAHEDTSYTYDKADRLTQVQDHAGNQWTYAYDLLGRRTQTVDPDAGTSTSTYDNAGQLITTTDGRGEVLWRKYDSLGRQTELRDDTAAGALRASWTYDTLDKGQLTSSTRHTSAGQYTTAVTDYDDGYRPLGASVTIPASELGVGYTTFTSTSTYHVDGSPATDVLPAVGGLPAETLTYGYSAVGLPTTMTSGTDTYVSATFYHYDNIVGQRYFGTGANRVRVTNPVEAGTRRLASSQLDTENPTTPDAWNAKSSTTYGYDQAGNVLSMAGTTNGATDQVECFRYDHHRRLKDAWTEASLSCATPQRAGADPYRLSWTYDVTGNRLTQQSWSTPTLSTTATSRYDPAGSGGPHAVFEVEYTGQGARPDDTFTYNNGGYTTNRTVDGVSQNLTWDPEGHLESTSQSGLSTSYVYDAGGNRLIRKDGTATTVYLGSTELKKTGSQIDGTRYYTHAGATVAVRTITGLTWLVPDHHGTNQISVDPTTLAMTRRRTLPFGETRGTPPAAWPGDKGFVGGTIDPTGLTHLGAREYDPTVGRFISVDPLMDIADPQTLNGYAYGNNAPVTFTDPSGLAHTEDTEGHITYHPAPSGNPPPPPKPEPQGGSRPGANPKDPSKTQDGKASVSLDRVAFEMFKLSYAALDGRQQRDVAVETFCYNAPDVCTEWDRQQDALLADFVSTLVLELTGIADAQACAGGAASGCVWTVIGFLPPRALKVPGAVGEALVKTVAKSDGITEDLIDTGIGCLNSFAPGTEVLMADGTTKPIEDIETGELVTATDPTTGTTSAKAVTATHINNDTDLTDLTLETGAGEMVLNTTDHHPFWSDDRRNWVHATDLDVGENLRTLDADSAEVTRVQSKAGLKLMYDLTVASFHTFYVLAGYTPVLVHNCDVFPDVGSLKGADPEDVLDAIPDNWIVSSPKKGEGIRFSNPNNPSQVIIYEQGWPNATDPTHAGPYLRVSNGVDPVYRIPLAGNPGL